MYVFMRWDVIPSQMPSQLYIYIYMYIYIYIYILCAEGGPLSHKQGGLIHQIIYIYIYYIYIYIYILYIISVFTCLLSNLLP
jgi:hypothetical protein